MTSLTVVAVLHASILAADSGTYAKAHQKTAVTGVPMVVMVSATWCQPCQQMKKTVLPQVEKHGLLKRVAFAVVDADRERTLAQRLIRGGPVPQLIMFSKTGAGWKRRKLIGRQTVGAVERFIQEGLTLNTAAKRPPATPQAAKRDRPAEKTAVRQVSRM